MRFIVRKFVDATNVADALGKEPQTPVHDVYLKDGEEPKRGDPKDLIGFRIETDPSWRKDEAR